MAAVFRHRNFRVYTVGNSISLIGTWIQRIATGWLTWELTGSGAWLGLMAFADLFPTVIVGPFAGAVADRHDRLSVTRISQALAFVLSAILFGLLAAGLITIHGLFVLTLLSGIVAAFNQPARLALIPSLVPRADLPSAVAINSIVFNIARFVGPAIAGLAIVVSGVAVAFALNAASFAVFFIALSRIRLQEPDIATKSGTSFLRELSDGYRYAASHPGLGAIFLLMIATCVGGRPVVELLPGFAAAVFDAGAVALATLTSSIGVGAIFAGLWLGGRSGTGGLTDLVLGFSLLLAVSIFAFAATDDIYLAVPAMAVCGFCMATTGIAVQTLIHMAVAPSMRGRVLSIHGLIFRGGPALGALAMGVVSDRIGLRLPLAIGAVTVVAAAAWAYLRRARMMAALEAQADPLD